MYVFGVVLACLCVSEVLSSTGERRAAEIIAELVTNHHDFFYRGMNGTAFVDTVDFLTGLQLENRDDIEWLLYEIRDPDHLRDLFKTMQENGFFRNIFNTIHRGFCAMIMPETKTIEDGLASMTDCDPSEPGCSHSHSSVPQWRSALRMLNAFVESGLCSQDVDGAHKMWDYVLRLFYFWVQDDSLDDYANNYFSMLSRTEPAHGAQMWTNCEHLTTVTKKLVDYIIEEASQFYPGAEQEIVDTAHLFTGITVTSRDEIKHAYCAILGGLSASGLDGVYEALIEQGIAWHGFQQLYATFEDTIRTWEWVSEHNHHYRPDTYTLLEELLQLTRQLGLMGLQ